MVVKLDDLAKDIGQAMVPIQTHEHEQSAADLDLLEEQCLV